MTTYNSKEYLRDLEIKFYGKNIKKKLSIVII